MSVCAQVSPGGLFVSGSVCFLCISVSLRISVLRGIYLCDKVVYRCLSRERDRQRFLRLSRCATVSSCVSLFIPPCRSSPFCTPPFSSLVHVCACVFFCCCVWGARCGRRRVSGRCARAACGQRGPRCSPVCPWTGTGVPVARTLASVCKPVSMSAPVRV